jgi:hypothetical protein
MGARALNGRLIDKRRSPPFLGHSAVNRRRRQSSKLNHRPDQHEKEIAPLERWFMRACIHRCLPFSRRPFSLRKLCEMRPPAK